METGMVILLRAETMFRAEFVPGVNSGRAAESESVGVGCFARSRSRNRSRQNLPTPTDSGQRLIRDSKKSPCLLINPRPAGPLDFPPPAGGGGAFERPPPPPHDLGSWSP